MRDTSSTASRNRVPNGPAVGGQVSPPCRRSHALLRGSDMSLGGWFRQVFHHNVARVAVGSARVSKLVLGVALLTVTPAVADMTASYDGTLVLPKQGENAIVASGLMQAGASLTGTVA